MLSRTRLMIFVVMFHLMLSVSGGGLVAQGTQSCGTDNGVGCAPENQRVDLAVPSFSNPTNITNPLFPISTIQRVVLLGTVDGFSFRTETSLLPESKVIEWNGQQIQVLTSQYVAFLDGRIHEVALDWYAQADDGSVWYLGEDVFNYEEGVVADTHGTWLAGREGPAAMIMPGNPQVGDVYRPENSPGVVFEEVMVTSVGQTVRGPHGPVPGAIVVTELHMDGSLERKIFAPGYGEFLSGSGGDLEAVAIAATTDVLSQPLPNQLKTLFGDAMNIFNAARSGDWNTASATLDTVLAAWDSYRAEGVSRLLDAQMSAALVKLIAAVDAQQPAEASQSALNTARASLDFHLRYRPVVEVDVALLDLWAAQILVDADDPSAIAGDVTALEWVWMRVSHTLEVSQADLVSAQLAALRAAADSEDTAAATSAAAQLRDILAGLS